MANLDHLAIVQRGADAWNASRRDWERSKWTEFPVRNLNLTDLTKPDLAEAQLNHADLFGANLVGADLRSANLATANLSGANLANANLSGTYLVHVNLGGAFLDHADLTGATLGSTILTNLDLSLTIGLDSLVHRGPSSIGIDTIFRSKGAIPEIFLRGAGVPDVFITYAKSLVGSAIEFYSCFISYSTRDQEFADRLYTDLQASGIRCWFAPQDLRGGRKLHEQIDEAIRFHDKLLLLLSPHSMSSEWVQTEISKARKREVRDETRVLFPISLAPFSVIREWESFDADTGKDSAREIREYFIPDFSNWKDHDCYQKAFERLLKDLKAPSEKSSKMSSGT